MSVDTTELRKLVWTRETEHGTHCSDCNDTLADLVPALLDDLEATRGKITRALEVVMDKRNILSPYVSRDELRRILTEGDPE